MVCAYTSHPYHYVQPESTDQLVLSVARVVVPDTHNTCPYGSHIWVGLRMASPMQEL